MEVSDVTDLPKIHSHLFCKTTVILRINKFKGGNYTGVNHQ